MNFQPSAETFVAKKPWRQRLASIGFTRRGLRKSLMIGVPLSMTSVAALFVIQFIYGWNQYLWPLLVTTEESMYTAVIGIKRMIVTGDALTEWNLVMATAMLALLPPALVVVLMQKWFVKGLVETEK